MKRLFLIDGHSLIFRMYYAFMRRPMINSKGEDTSILFGFTKYLLELIRKEQPTHIAVAFDPPAKTFRHELYPEYKANRSAAPELVKAALDPLVEIVGALGIPVVMKPGFEADDVIGSIAKQESKRGFDVYMVSPDKDLGQLIDEHVFQYKPGKAGADDEVYDRAKLCETYGISDPLNIIDILTIWGDASDNIPGVTGIGEVGAKKLVGKYGTVENILEHLEELSPKQQQSFRDAMPHLQLSKTLATIKTDIDLDLDEDALLMTACCDECVAGVFDRYEFNSLRKLLPEGVDAPSVAPQERSAVHIVEVQVSTLAEAAEKHGRVACRADGEMLYLALGSDYASCRLDALPQPALKLLSDTEVSKIGHGLKSTVVALLDKGVEVRGELQDIELMHYLLNPERTHKMEILVHGYLDKDIDKEEAVAPQAAQQQPQPAFDLFSAPLEVAPQQPSASLRPARECAAVCEILPIITKELEEQGLMGLYRQVEMPLITVLADMEHTGVKVDPQPLAEYSRQLTTELLQIEAEARELAGEPLLNLSSPRQIGVVLYEKLDLNPKVRKNKRENYPTDEETLTDLKEKHPFVGKVLEYRALKKLISTYLDPLPALINSRTGKIHTTFNQALTATGRLSSVKPNLQNIPVRSERGREIRKAFVPSTPDGFIVSADYSQIELRLMAELSRDPALVEGFNNGADIHADTASRIFHTPVDEVTKEQRRRAKVANFGIIYGISAFGLSQRMGISRTESKEFISEYFKHYPAVKAYMDNAVQKAKETGCVETIFGRKRYLPDINSRNQVVRSLAERNAINAPIQGSAADIIKKAMINVWAELKRASLKSKMVLQVHDELIIDVVAEELEDVMTIVKREMEGVCTLSVPLEADCNYGKNWLEAH
jgi:DNA polymerase I